MPSSPSWLPGFCDAIAAEYRVVRPLGEGGMATVMLAEERSLKRLVAIKILDPELAEDPTYRTRFAREAEAAARLQHPNIVPIYRVGEAAGRLYYAMQYVEGETLAARVSREGPLDAATATRIARDVAQALGAAHRRGIVHRDIKPQNILIDAEDGRALVTDFGIARLMRDEDASATLTADQLTGVGRLIGTPRYMSPEQAGGGQPIGPASDLYSLGVVLYEMLSGAFPYEELPGRNPMLAHVIDTVVPLGSRVPDIPADLATITGRLLAKNPGDRYSSTDALIAALGGTPPSGTAASARPRPRSRRLLLAGAVAGFVAIAAFAAVRLGAGAGPREDPRRSLLVGYFENTARDPALEWLRVGGVELMARALARWVDLRVVETSRLLDLTRKASIAEGAALSQDEVLGLAREAGAGTAGLGSVLRTGTDRSSITLRLYDVRSGALVSEVTEEVAADSLLPGAFAKLADRVFSIAGAPANALVDAEPPTRSLAAYRAYVAAVRAANHWQLDSAEALLATAVEADPAFALAWARRAMTRVIRDGPFREPASYLAWADSSLKYVAGRPAKERLLIEGYHHFLAAQFGEARAAARRLIALDSLSAEGWSLLGLATIIDRFLVPDAAGRDSTGYDPTLVIRAFRRSLALDGSNHQSLAMLGGMLNGAAYETPSEPLGQIAIGRSRPEALNRLPRPTNASYRMVMVSPDSFRFGPTAEVNRVTTPAELARSRELAMGALRQTVDQWLTVGPDEGQAHALRANLAELDGDFDGAFAAFERSVSLGAWLSPYSPDWERLRLALVARRDSLALSLTTGLEQRLEAERPKLANDWWTLSVLAHSQLMAGRVRVAQATWAARDSMRARMVPRIVTFNTMLSDTLQQIRTRAWSGWMSRAELEAAERRTAAFIATFPDSLKSAARFRLLAPLGLPAATLGDTARLAALRATIPGDGGRRFPGLDALAAALAGDRAGAEGALARAAADTAFPWPGSRFTAGQAAHLLGRHAEALRFHQAVDSAALGIYGALDMDWVLFTRSLKGRADAALALGDTATARRHYQRFVRLWSEADPVFRPERDSAAAALASLTPGDHPPVRSIPR